MRKTTFFDRMIAIGERKAKSQVKDTFFIASDIARFSKYINKVLDSNPSVTDEKEMERILLDDYYYHLSPKVLEGNFSFDNYMDLMSCKHLQAHQEDFDKIYAKISSKDFTPKSQCETFTEYLENYVYKSLYKNEDIIISNARQNLDYQEQKILDRTDLSQEEKLALITKHINEDPNILSDNAKTSFIHDAQIATLGIKYSLPDNQRALENVLRNDLETSITSLISTLKQTGAYETYAKVNYRNFSQLQFNEFHSCSGKFQDDNGSYIDLDVNPEALHDLDIDTLLLLNSFWLNRFTKELNAYSTSLSVIHEKGLLSQIRDSSIDPDQIMRDNITPILIKKNAIFPVINTYITKVQKSIFDGQILPGTIREESLRDNKDSCYLLVSYDPLKQIVQKSNFDEEYKDYFDEILPTSENDAQKDVIFYATLLNPSIMAYNEKSNYLCALLTNLSNGTFINAGVIPNGVNPTDSSKLRISNFTGIGIDANLTFPVREHLHTDFIKNFMKSYTGSTILPIYENAEDFMVESTRQLASAQLVLPFSEDQIQLLQELKSRKESVRNPKLLEHMAFLAEQKELLEQGYSFKRKYVDIEDGQIYIKENDKFIKCTLDKTPTSSGNTEKGDSNSDKDSIR